MSGRRDRRTTGRDRRRSRPDESWPAGAEKFLLCPSASCDGFINIVDAGGAGSQLARMPRGLGLCYLSMIPYVLLTVMLALSAGR